VIPVIVELSSGFEKGKEGGKSRGKKNGWNEANINNDAKRRLG
jgi:hypothetical protein